MTPGLLCPTLNDAFDMLQQQGTLYFEYTNLEFYIQFQIAKSNSLCRQGSTCKLTAIAPISSGHGLHNTFCVTKWFGVVNLDILAVSQLGATFFHSIIIINLKFVHTHI